MVAVSDPIEHAKYAKLHCLMSGRRPVKDKWAQTEFFPGRSLLPSVRTLLTSHYRTIC